MSAFEQSQSIIPWEARHYGISFNEKKGEWQRDMSVPSFVWTDRYTDKWLLIQHAIKLCDWMLWNRYRSNSINPLTNYLIRNAQIIPEDYENLTHTYGEGGPATLKGYDFFGTSIAAIKNKILDLPIRFSIEQTNEEAAKKWVTKASKLGAEMVMRNAFEKIKQQSQGQVDLTAFKDREQYVPPTEDALYDYLNEKEAIEMTAYELLRDAILRSNMQVKLTSCLEDFLIIAGEFGRIKPSQGDPMFERLDPESVSWIGNDFFESMDEHNAVSATKWITLSTAIEKYGQSLVGMHDYQDLVDLVMELTKQDGAWTNFAQPMRDRFFNANSYTYPPALVPNAGSSYFPSSWFSNYYLFDPMMGATILEQTVEFKFLKMLKYAVKYGGKNISDDDFKELQKKGRSWEKWNDVVFLPVDDDYEPLSGEKVWENPNVEIWEAIRLGHKYFVQLRKKPNQFRKERDIVNPGFDFIGRVSPTQSLVSIGKPMYEMYVTCLYLAQKAANMSGVSVLYYDKQQKPNDMDWDDILFTAKEAGMVIFDSSQAPNNGAGSKHMSMGTMSNQTDIAAFLNLAAMIRSTFNATSGITPELQGQPSKDLGLGQSQMALSAGSLLNAHYYMEHGKFVKMVMEKMLNLGRTLWAKNELRTVGRIGQEGYKVIKMTEDIAYTELGIFIMDSYEDEKKREAALKTAEIIFQAGRGLTELEAMLSLQNATNPDQAVAIVRQANEAMLRMQQQAAQQEQQGVAQMAQMKADIDKLKASAPMEVAKINQQTEMMKLQQKDKHNQMSLQFKEDKADVDQAYKLQQKAVDIEAGTEQMAQQQMHEMNMVPPAAENSVPS